MKKQHDDWLVDRRGKTGDIMREFSDVCLEYMRRMHPLRGSKDAAAGALQTAFNNAEKRFYQRSKPKEKDMTRKEFESLSLNARLWAKVGAIIKRQGDYWTTPGMANRYPSPAVLLEENAPRYDSDETPRWRLQVIVKHLRKRPERYRFLELTAGVAWRELTSRGMIDAMSLPAADLAAAVESVLPLPEWVTE